MDVPRPRAMLSNDDLDRMGGPGSSRPMLLDAGARAELERAAEEWWEASDPADEEGPWVVILYHPDTPQIADRREFTEYLEALNWGESQMPMWDVDICPVSETEP